MKRGDIYYLSGHHDRDRVVMIIGPEYDFNGDKCIDALDLGNMQMHMLSMSHITPISIMKSEYMHNQDITLKEMSHRLMDVSNLLENIIPKHKVATNES